VTVFGDHGREAGLTPADILSVLASPSGMVWAGSRRAGIDILDPAGARIGRVGADSSQQSATLPPSNIHAMVAMPDGAVIAGTGRGLYRIGTDGAVRHLAVPGLGQTDAVRALRLIGGVLWVGGPDGAWALRPDANDAEGGMQVLRRVAGDALSHPRVRCLVPGPDGAVWVGTPHGLNLVPPAPAPIEMIMAEPGNPASLSSSTIITMVTDRQGRLWVGTLDRGLNLMTGRDQAGHPVFRRFGLAQGVPNDSIDALILDRHGTIWASTDGGIIAVDPDTLAVRAYGAAEGVAIPGYFSGAADVGPDGDLVFGGMGGLTIVRPDLLGRPATHPPLLATEIRVGGRIVQPDGKPLRVTPKANSLSVQFASLDFTAPERLRYAYRLDGYDRDWVEVDAAHRLAAYTNLPPGQYVLNLRGSNRDGDWTGMPVRLPVRVLPAWHQTWWCHVVELMASGLAIAGLLQTRTAWIRGRQHELERQVAERTAELLQSQARLHEAAYGDLLTGLANRRAFTEHFRGMAAPPSGEPGRFILLLIDLDGFKQVNDTLGHDVGDAVLLAAANRVRQSVREADFVARLGGDEFAVLLGAPADPDLPGQMCERLIEAMSMPVSVNGVTARIGASVGAAVFPDHGSSQELLYKSADLALYDAKRAGRGVARWFSAWPGAEMAYREGALPAA
jgi:diguanylate cyclase (GGDEF)-like protein